MGIKYKCTSFIWFSASEISNGEFDWSPQTQGLIIGAFYYGYCITQLPGGRLAELYGGKLVFGLGVFISALLNLVTPFAARLHVACIVAVRVLEGLAQGITMPAMFSMQGRWLPESEKNFLSTIIYSGISVGWVVGSSLSGVICNTEIFGGWPASFYIFGVTGCCWFLIWLLLATDIPASHPCITNMEIDFIVANQKIDNNHEIPPVPWKKIFTSIPFWAFLITAVAQDWSFYIILNDLPTFYDSIMHINIELNGFLSSFPSILETVVMLLLGYFTDAVIRKEIASVNFVRKFCNSVAGLGPAICLVGVCLSGCNVPVSVTFFVFSNITAIFNNCGYMLSPLDMSPEYAGTLIGISNTISNLTGFLAPLVVGTLTNTHQTLQQWHIVFIITITILLISCIIFILFSSTDKQNWISNPNRQVNTFQESETKIYDYGSAKIELQREI